MLYKDLNNAGVFKLMPNGFNMYDDITGKPFHCTILNNDVLYTINGKPVFIEQINNAEVVCIGSDPNGALEVPAIWIRIG